VLGVGPAESTAEGLLEQRVDLDRLAQLERRLQLAPHVERRTEDEVGLDAVGLRAPVELLAGPTGGRAGRPRLAAAQQRHVEVAVGDGLGRLAEQRGRAVAAVGGEHGLHVAEPERRRDERGGVAVAAREQRHDAHRPGGVEDAGRAAVGRGAAERLGHEVDRLERGLARPDGDLTDADDDRRAVVVASQR
jgi:hypothetical protein